jgi:hypothetical protein
MSFDYPVPYGRFRLSVGGIVWAEKEPVEGAGSHMNFETKGSYPTPTSAWIFKGFDEFPLEWASPYYASGTLLGEQLQVGDGEEFLTFVKRK